MEFGHHPNAANDFCIEVEELAAIMLDRENGFPNPDDGDLERRIDRAMLFRVGADAIAVDAKRTLREIEDRCIESLARRHRQGGAATRTGGDQKARVGDAPKEVRAERPQRELQPVRTENKQGYRDMSARVFVRAVRDAVSVNVAEVEFILSEGEATDLVLLRELDAAVRGKTFVATKQAEALKIARDAIASADAGAFGWGEQTLHGTPYPIRDELLATIDAALVAE